MLFYFLLLTDLVCSCCELRGRVYQNAKNQLTKCNMLLSLLSSAISCLLVSVNLDLSQYALDIVKGLASKYSKFWREW